MSQGSQGDPSGLARYDRVRVWDVPTRAFHWGLLVLIGSAYCTRNYSSDPTLYWHRLNGYAIIALLIFRLLWGVVGSSTARFAAFVPHPTAVARYAMALMRGRPLHYLGHNPLGSLLIFAMLLAVSAQAFTGLFTSDDSFAQGPLVDHASDHMVNLASALHAKGFWVILALVIVHVLANLGYQVVLKDRLIWAMIDGTKPRARYHDQQEARMAPGLRALVCLVIAVGVVAIGVRVAGQSLLR